MRCKSLRTITVATFLLTAAVGAHAADLRNVLIDYTVTSWSMADGLPGGTIWALAQDRDGFLWVGGDFGLLRFDGVRFTAFDEFRGTDAEKRHTVRLLAASQDGSVWVAWDDRNGIARLRDGHVSTYTEKDGLPASAVTSLFEDRRGIVWAGTSSGFYQYEDAAGRWSAAETSGKSTGAPVRTASIGASGTLLVVTDAVVSRQAGSGPTVPLEHLDPSDPIRSIAEDRRGRVWVTDRVVGFRQVGQEKRSRAHAEGGKGQRLLVDHRGNLWVATFGQGLWRALLDEGTDPGIERATVLTGLSNDVIYSLLEDRDGNIWAGTTDGLNRLSPRKVTQITNLGLVTGLELGGENQVWAGTDTGLARLAYSGSSWQKDAELRGARVDAMSTDRDGTLWAATGGRLLQFRPDSANPVLVTALLRHVKALTSDLKGGVWVYDLDEGLVHWSSGRLEPFPLPAQFRDARITALHVDREARLWMGLNQGQVAVASSVDDVRAYGRTDGLDVGGCRAIYEDRDGVLWVGGSRGLSRFSEGRFITAHLTHLATESVTGIVEDNADGLWVGTASGIVRITRNQWKHRNGREETNNVVLNAAQGVASTAGWNGQRSVVRVRDGTLWFLTDSGITVVDPKTFKEDAPLAPIRMDGISVNERRLPMNSALRLPAGVTRLEIDYTVPDLTAPRRTRFRYRLEGFDADWIDAGTARRAMYTNLAPRAYRFRVEANDPRGTWARAAVFDFSVAPAFYQTPWFVGAAIAVVALGGWSIWHLRLRQIRNRFALLLQERVRLSREIHDTLLQSLVGVGLQLDIVGRELSEPASNQAHFVRLRKQLEEYIREARQSIWNLRSSALQEHDLLAALKEYGDRIAERDLALRFSTTGKAYRCEPHVEEQILKVGQEAILNAVRHSGAKEIRVEVEYARKSLTLRVADNGKGFNPIRSDEMPTDHWGVLTMKERAQTVGGELRVLSREGEGTEIEVVVPVRI